MNVALRKPMSRADFLVWVERQEAPYEFDGFQPVAMNGGNLRHHRLIGNIFAHLRDRLAGKRCQPLGPGAGVATTGNAVRYPDAVVTCSPLDDEALLVPGPVVVFEVLSPNSVRRDRVVKLREYQAVGSIRRYVIVEAGEIAVTVMFRDEGGELFRTVGLGEGEVLDLPEIGIELPLAEIYQGIAFAPPDSPADA